LKLNLFHKKNTRVAALHKLLEEVTAEKYEHAGELSKLQGQVNDKFSNLEATAEKKKRKLLKEILKNKRKSMMIFAKPFLKKSKNSLNGFLQELTHSQTKMQN